MSCLNYNEFINRILETRGRFGIPNGQYKERHHIIPKCLKGDDKKTNLIDLYASEHYIAHKLLAQENPTVHSLVFAWNKMAKCKSTNQERDYIISEEDYEKLKIAMKEALTKRNISEETRKKISESRKGKISKLRGIPRSLEVKQKISNAKKGCIGNAKGTKHTEIHNLRISLSGKGKHNHVWYNNGIENIRIKPEEQPPCGYIRGMKMKRSKTNVLQ